jgi:hypothetical protein
MKWSHCLAAVLAAGAVWTSGARAEGPWLLFDGCRWNFRSLCDEWQGRCCWCADDYSPKALPDVPPNPHGCVDDYCRKPLPHVPPNEPGCVDDYCRKTCSLFLRALCEPWYQCGPPERQCVGCPGKR